MTDPKGNDQRATEQAKRAVGKTPDGPRAAAKPSGDDIKKQGDKLKDVAK